MLIEIVGLPGSGKTTFSKAFMREAQAAGRAVNTAQHLSADTSQNKRTPRFVKARKERALLHRYVRFQRRHPKLDALAVAQFDDKPIRHLLYSMMAASYQGVRDLEDADEIVMMDEGFITHGVATFFENDNARGLNRYIKLAPLVDMVMLLDAPAAVAHARATERGGGDEKSRKAAEVKHGNLVMFEKREAILRRAVDTYTSRGVPLVTLNSAIDAPDTLAQKAFAALAK